MPASTCPGRSSQAATAAKDFSKWVDMNYAGMTALLDDKRVSRILLEFGTKVGGLPRNYDWQVNAIFFGKWGQFTPDPNIEDPILKMIYKVNNNELEFVQSINCHTTNSCGLGTVIFTNDFGQKQINNFIDTDKHLNHFDLEVL